MRASNATRRPPYYAGTWKPAYDRWVQMLAGMYAGDAGKLVAWNQALTSDMIMSQPVVYEFDRIAVPTTLLIGQKVIPPRSARIGRQPRWQAHLATTPSWASWPISGSRGPCSSRFQSLAIQPQVQDPVQFNEALLQQLARFR